MSANSSLRSGLNWQWMRGESGASVGDILLHLRDQCRDGSKLQLIAEFCHQVQAEGLAVEVCIIVEQKSLDGLFVHSRHRR